MRRIPSGLLALSPLFVFLAVYFVSSAIIGDFYKVPVSAAFMIACIWSIAIDKGSIKDRVASFSKGASDSNVLLMIWIFILAGAFAQTAKDIGSVEATVNATLNILPSKMIFVGLFITACFISMAVGTSVGTIVALMPIGAGVAVQAGVSEAFMAALIVGGAFFGDNLSFISDTTIAATRAVGCEMHDKFKTNIKVVAPAVIVVAAIYLIQGNGVIAHHEAVDAADIVKIIPYLLVIVLALCRMNVCIVLSCGIAANAALGFMHGDFSWSGWLESLGRGIAGMNELIIVTLLAGGLLGMIRKAGGLDFLMDIMSRSLKGKKSAQASIASLVSLANICTANNTIAIITTGGIANDITKRFNLDPRKTASILDTFSCFIQGLIPYGAQLLMAAGLAGVSPTAIIPHLYYTFAVGVCASLAIVFGRNR